MMQNKKISKDIFVSYRRADGAAFAQLLTEHLDKRGYSVFFDRKDLHVGSDFPMELKNAIESAKDVILIISKSYFGENKEGKKRIFDENDWIRQELKYALQYNKNIIPILSDNSVIPTKEELPDELVDVTDRQFIKYNGEEEYEVFINKFVPYFSPETIQNSTKNHYLEELKKLGSEDTPNYNIIIRNLVVGCTEKNISDYIVPIISSEVEELQTRFAAYYAAFTFYRRFSYRAKIQELVEQYGEFLGEFKFSNIVMTQYYSYLYEERGGDVKNLSLSIMYAERAKELLPENSGVLVTYAELIVIALEAEEKSYYKKLPEAIEAIQKAMQLNVNYPKHYCIYGLLVSFRGEYEEALNNIKRAIDLEDSEKKDAFIRIMKYNNYIIDVKQRKHQVWLRKQIDDLLTIGVIALVLSIIAILLFLLR